jgi:ribose 1,5-bisphosphokinase PhnN
MTDHLKDPQAVSWEDLSEEFAFTDAEKDRIAQGAQVMINASRVRRLAELPKRQHPTQVEVAKVIRISFVDTSGFSRGRE